MKNRDSWKPTKYLLDEGKLRANPESVGAGSLLFAELTARWYSSAMPRFCSGRVLDLGCGAAPFNVIYESLTTESVCVDWPNSPHDINHADVEHDLGKALPFSSNEFDTVLLSDVLEHVNDPDLLLAEVARVIKPGGHLLLNIPFLYWLHEVPHDNQRFTEFALKRKVVEAGLEVAEFSVVGGGVAVLADVISKIVATTHRRCVMARLLQKIVLRLHAYVRIRNLTVRNGIERFPIGYCLAAIKP